MLKTTLMDQSFVAGVGNIYADEICFQTGVHPKIKVNKFSRKKWNEIFVKTKKVLQTAINLYKDENNLPDSWLIPNREEKISCPKCEDKVKKIKVSSRSTYYCPSCQNKN